jgi:hypothetical protein
LPGVGGTVGHDETGSTGFVERTLEELNPKVVRVIGAGHPEGEAWIIVDPFFVDLVDVERGIGHHEVKLGQRVVQVVAIAVPFFDVPGEAMDGEVHQAEVAGIVHPLLAIDRDRAAGVVLAGLDEFGTLDVHATGAAGMVHQATVKRFDDLDDQLHQRRRREELAPLLPLGPGEIAQKIFIDATEFVTFGIEGDGGEVC